MNMNKDTYERLNMDVTEFDTEDVITTSGITPGGNTPPDFSPTGLWEMPVNM